MVCRVQDASGAGCAVHRTYLGSNGQKASVSTAKKLAGKAPAGAAIRLSAPSGYLGIAEGVETALSAFLLFGVPTWAAISAGGLERWSPPDDVRRVIVFGDNDVSGTGQAAAWSLAKRLIASGVDTQVRIPETVGKDWADREAFEERAAIMEFDGGLSRAEAERLARGTT